MANKPNNPTLWSKAKSLAKQKFDVYPSAYANGWAAKWYKSKGGTWSKAAEYGMEVMEDGGMPYGTYAPPMFAAGGTPCYECGGMYADGGEADGGMALTQINAMMERLNNLRKYIKQDSDLDPWISDKLSVMNHSATAINDYMQYGEPQEEEMMEMAQGGGIPERYKNMGFTKVGVKKESTRPGKKWMVLAKKGDQYKVVHGGYDGMKDYTQHGSEDRRERFWDRMGGRDSAKAKDPFSPLYWHKRFGTWEAGGELPEMQYAGTTPPRSFWEASLGLVPGVETVLDASDVVQGAWKGDKEQMNRGLVGLGQPVSGKAVGSFVDYLTEQMLGKETADKNAQKRNGIINMSGADLQKLYIKYGPGGYDKWVSEGMPKLEGGGPYDSMIQEGDQTLNVTSKRTLNNLENNGWNRGLAVTNSLVDPRSPIHFLPDKGFGSGLKAIAGLAAGLSGATLGYEKLFSNTKTDNYLYNQDTKEAGKRDDVLKARWDKANPTPAIPATTPPAVTKPLSNMTPTGGSGMGAVLEDPNSPKNMYEFERGGYLPRYQYAGSVDFRTWFSQNAQRPDVLSIMGNRAALEELWKKETGQTQQTQTTAQPAGPLKTAVGPTANNDGNDAAGWFKPATPQWQQDFQYTQRGDNAGFVAANNALIGLGMTNQVLGQKQLQKQYNQQMVNIGNTDSMYNAVNPSNPYGNYTTNVGIGPNFALVRQTAAQDFSDANLARYGGMKKYKQGGSYMVSDKELMEILANGGDVEFL